MATSSDYYFMVTAAGKYFYTVDKDLKIAKSKIPKELHAGIKLGSKQQPIDGVVVTDENADQILKDLSAKRASKKNEQKDADDFIEKAKKEFEAHRRRLEEIRRQAEEAENRRKEEEAENRRKEEEGRRKAKQEPKPKQEKPRKPTRDEKRKMEEDARRKRYASQSNQSGKKTEPPRASVPKQQSAFPSLIKLGITSKLEWKQWLVKNHPDKNMGIGEDLCKHVISEGRREGW